MDKASQCFYYKHRIGTGSYLVGYGIVIREKHCKVISAIEQAAPLQNETQKGGLESMEARIGSLGGVTE